MEPDFSQPKTSQACYNHRMDLFTAQRLLEINRQFYADFGTPFSATRKRIQPGVRKVILNLAGNENILDLGCGNGELARTLAQINFRGTYTGLDFSLPLLKDARTQPAGLPVTFYEADLTTLDWNHSFEPTHFSLVTAFAVLHHIPGADLRRIILQNVRNLLQPDGKFILSNWQFLNSEKLRQRIQAWEMASISASDVDEGDYLLDWRSGGQGLRYVHHFTSQELNLLAGETGFDVIDTFHSDGEGARLGLYQIWSVHENKR